MRVLVGYVEHLKHSGIDKYLLNVLKIAKENNIQIDFLSSVYDEEAVALLESMGSRVYRVRSLKNPIGHFCDVKKALNFEKYDKAYFNISEPLNMFGPMAAHSKKVITMIHSHAAGIDCPSFIKRNFRMAINFVCKRFLWRFGDEFYACSRKAGNWLFPKKITASDRFKLIYNIIDTDLFSFVEIPDFNLRREFNYSDNSLLVGFAGHFCYQKNNYFLIDIFNDLIKISKDAKMILLGTGPDLDRVKQKVNQLGLSDKILFLGVRNDWPNLIKMLDVFLLPSRFEGLPLVALEAQFTGVPTLISDKIDEMTVISDNTIRLPIDSSKLWAKKIVEVSDFPRKRVEETFSKMFSMQENNEQVLRMLRGE